MSKRILAGTLGLIVLFASLVALNYAKGAIDDLENPAVSYWTSLSGNLILWAIALAAMAFGVRFLRFSLTGKSGPDGGIMTSLLLGVGCFFPGFIFSLPLTIFFAHHVWPGNIQKEDAALRFSIFLGVASAILPCIILLHKRRLRQMR